MVEHRIDVLGIQKRIRRQRSGFTPEFLAYCDEDGKWTQSSCRGVEDTPEPTQAGQRLNVRSWRGKHDRDIVGFLGKADNL